MGIIPQSLITPRYKQELVRRDRVDPGRMTVRGATTYPDFDLDGDFVRPDGGDWSEYPKDPLVNYEHVVRVGRGRIDMLAGSAVFPGDPVAKSHRIPVLTTTFFQSVGDLSGLPLGGLKPAEALEASEQTFRLIESGHLRGLSLEFHPVHGCYRVIGKSLLKRRPAYDFQNWVGVGVAHCARGVNPKAGLTPHLKSMAAAGRLELPPEVNELRTIAERGRFPGGKPLCPVIRKSLRWLAELPRPAAVVGGYAPRTKAMPADATEEFETAPADPGAEQTPADDGFGDDGAVDMKPGPTAYAKFAQALMDAADAAVADSAGSDHPDIEADIADLAEEVKALAAKALAEGRDKFPKAGLDAPEGTPAESADLPANEDGALVGKAFKKGFRVRFRPVGVVADGAASAGEPEDGSALLAPITKKARHTERGVRQLDRFTRPGRKPTR